MARTRKHWFTVFWFNARVQDHGSYQLRAVDKEAAIEEAHAILKEDKNYNRMDINIQNVYQIFL